MRATQLPAITPVHVAIGGTRSGFEALAFVLTDSNGELMETVELPSWTAQDRTHRFIIFDAYFSPLSVTEPFHVTAEDGTILREGEVTDAGPTCATMSGADSEVYSFVGRTEGLEVGRRVVVEARIVESAECREGIPIRVAGIRSTAANP